MTSLDLSKATIEIHASGGNSHRPWRGVIKVDGVTVDFGAACKTQQSAKASAEKLLAKMKTGVASRA